MVIKKAYSIFLFNDHIVNILLIFMVFIITKQKNKIKY